MQHEILGVVRVAYCVLRSHDIRTTHHAPLRQPLEFQASRKAVKPRFIIVALLATLFFLLAAAYSIVTPIFESPDELWHYPFVWRLSRTAQLPVQDPASPQLWGQEGSQPPLYYALAALLTAALPADDLPELIDRNPHADLGVVTPDGNINIVVHTEREAWPWSGAVLAIHVTRLFSVLLGTATVLTVYTLGRTIWPDQPHLALLAMAFVAFNPMFLFISGSVNNDNLITLLASLVLWRLVTFVGEAPPQSPPEGGKFRSLSLWDAKRFLLQRAGVRAKKTFTPKDTITRIVAQATTLGLLTGLAALTKVSGLGLLGLVGLTLLILGAKQRSWQIAILGNAIVGLLTLAIAGWWYWRNLQLYGDWTGTEIMVRMMGARPVAPTAGQLLSELPGLMRSFWGLFGYFSVPMPAWIYTALNLMLGLGLLGLAAAAVGGAVGWSGARREQIFSLRFRRAWPILLGWLAILVIGLIQWTLRTPATQGRLLFPAIASVAILWTAGWAILMPERWRWLPVAGMLVVAVWVPWGVITPAYAKPQPFVELPSSAEPLDVIFGGSVRLLGFENGGSSVWPGDSLPLTLYWRAEQPLETDYTVFIHLLDENELVLAQRNLFHGGGLYPTGHWTQPRQFADTYVLQLPRTTFAPAQARFEVGLYDHTTGQRLLTGAGQDNVRFGEIAIEPLPGEFPNPQALLFEDGITLAGYELDRQQLPPGEALTLTLYWHARGRPAADYKVFVHLVGDGGQRIAQHDSEPQNGAAPTSTWTPNQVIIDPHPLTLAPDAPPGAYRLVVGLYDGATGQRQRLLRHGDAYVQADSVTLAGVRVVSR